MSSNTPEQLAVIDMGTNTFHMLIVEREGESFKVLDKIKEPVKLGEGGIQSNVISPAAYERGLLALQKLDTIIQSRGISQVFAFATSAVRSATNGKAFIQDAAEQTGIQVQVINGNQEAALIYEGIKYGVSLPVHQDVLIVDIGGGSVEFIVGNRLHSKLLRSVNIGAARLREIFQPADPLLESQEQAIEQLLDQELSTLIEEIRDFDVHTLVGSSGTFETLGMMLVHDANEKILLDNLNGYKFDNKRFRKLYKRIVTSTREERTAIRGMDLMRVDMIVLGSIIVRYILDKLPIQEIVVSTFALKEGILVNYLNEQRDSQRPEVLDYNQRKQSVNSLALKFGCNPEKGHYVAGLALSLFDQTKFIHQLGALERELLEYATRLVDVGHFIHRSGHHKHGQYIIQNSGMPGFSGKELILLGNIVRYHRKSLPSEEHWHFNVLYKEDKSVVNKLGALIRLAVNLNRAQRQIVETVLLSFSPGLAIMEIHASQPARIEVEAVVDAKALFEKAFDLRLEVHQA
jgi:exopolyphosphatase / guanosine-5'-triphosphate,3'-diphosphate pyrophosphatase